MAKSLPWLHVAVVGWDGLGWDDPVGVVCTLLSPLWLQLNLLCSGYSCGSGWVVSAVFLQVSVYTLMTLLWLRCSCLWGCPSTEQGVA